MLHKENHVMTNQTGNLHLQELVLFRILRVTDEGALDVVLGKSR